MVGAIRCPSPAPWHSLLMQSDPASVRLFHSRLWCPCCPSAVSPCSHRVLVGVVLLAASWASDSKKSPGVQNNPNCLSMGIRCVLLLPGLCSIWWDEVWVCILPAFPTMRAIVCRGLGCLSAVPTLPRLVRHRAVDGLQEVVIPWMVSGYRVALSRIRSFLVSFTNPLWW
jgi:hypothetical protein